MSACTNHDYTVLLTIAGGLIVMALIPIGCTRSLATLTVTKVRHR